MLGLIPTKDKDKLLIVSDPSDILQKGILINKEILVLFHPFLRRAFQKPNAFNKQLIDKLRAIKRKERNLKISFLVVPTEISLKAEFKESFEFDFAWGPKMPKNLNELQLGVTKYLFNEKEKTLENINETDFWWHKKRPTLFALEIEEIRDKTRYIPYGSNKYYPNRYLHLQFDSNKRKIIHLDCALRIYSETDFDNRLNQNDISKAGKLSDRIKLFRIDGELDPKEAFEIAMLFFHNNPDVRRYLESE